MDQLHQRRMDHIAIALGAGIGACGVLAAQAAAAAQDSRVVNFVTEGKKIIGVGKNYREHVKELAAGDNPLWKDDGDEPEPILFIKPTSSYVKEGNPIVLPRGIGEIHHELELGVVIGKECGPAQKVTEADSMSYVGGYCLALDLTARDVQLEAKAKGTPWMISKSYDCFAPVSEYVPASEVPDCHDLDLWMTIGGKMIQKGNTVDMIHSVPKLIAFISTIMTLEPGDMISTGTPEGVGPFVPGDEIEAGLVRSGTTLTSFKFTCT